MQIVILNGFFVRISKKKMVKIMGFYDFVMKDAVSFIRAHHSPGKGFCPDFLIFDLELKIRAIL